MLIANSISAVKNVDTSTALLTTKSFWLVFAKLRLFQYEPSRKRSSRGQYFGKMAASIASLDDTPRDFHTNSPEIDAESERWTVFSGCSEDDQACAKMFWKSLTLHPPIESRLVSGDIRQRLPVAAPGGQRKLINKLIFN